MGSSGKQPPVTALDRSALEQLWRRLRHDPVALASVGVLVLLYATILFAGFLAPYSAHWNDRALANASPTPVYMVDSRTGGLTAPYVLPVTKSFNPATFAYEYAPDLSQPSPVQFLVKGEPYTILGFIPGDVHLFGTTGGTPINLLGTDINGRDIFSRMLFGGQVSLTIGFLGLLIAFPMGMIYGGLSGYLGGWIDNAMMRLAEIIMSIPTLYLLIGLAAIIPPNLSSSSRFAMVVVILALIGWAPLSRVIRGMVLSIKSQEFVEASRSIGLKTLPIIIRHVLPQTASYVLVAITLSVPGYILAESGLSFLGLGIQQPDASWGNMLKEAQDINNLLNRPLMMSPGFLIFLAVLAFNVLGDAVRDILDPKSAVRR
ncbi:MAG: ABC transporter permease [Candidatus Melainabacteria bacterium]